MSRGYKLLTAPVFGKGVTRNSNGYPAPLSPWQGDFSTAVPRRHRTSPAHLGEPAW